MSSDALAAVVSTLRNWLSRGHSATQTVRLEVDGDVIDLSAASAADAQRLVDLFVSRHSQTPNGSTTPRTSRSV